MTDFPISRPGQFRVKLEEVTPSIVAAYADTSCLIWSGEHSAWWRAGCAGYTTSHAAAGRYTLSAAYAATNHCDPSKGIAFERLETAAASGEVERSTLSNPSTFGKPTFGFEDAISAASGDVSPDAPIYLKLREITDEQRAHIRRIMSGEADEDRIRRGDVHQAVRSLRTNPVPSHEYQRALGDVGKLVAALSAAPPAQAGTPSGEVERDPAARACHFAQERAKMIAAYEGPVVSFDVAADYYLASCDACGWVGSSEKCGSDEADDVFCPRCQASGADCGAVAERIQADQGEVCAVPGCDTITAEGICGACDDWVSEEVAKLPVSTGLELAARWHDGQAATYAADIAALRGSDADQARIDQYETLHTEHIASAAAIRVLDAAATAGMPA